MRPRRIQAVIDAVVNHEARDPDDMPWAGLHQPHTLDRDGAPVRGRARCRRPGRYGETTNLHGDFACPEHGVSLPELQPRIFSLQLAARRLPALHRARRAAGDRPDLLVPDPSLSIAEGALVPWSVGQLELLRVGHPGARRPLRDRPRHAVARADRGAAEPLPLRHGRRADLRPLRQPDGPASAQYVLAFEGIMPNLERRYRETDSSQQRERIEEYMSFRPVPDVRGRAAEAGGARGHGRRPQHPRVHEAVGHARARVPRRARADRGRAS